MRLWHIQVPQRRGRRARNTWHTRLRGPRSAKLRTDRRANRYVVRNTCDAINHNIITFWSHYAILLCKLYIHRLSTIMYRYSSQVHWSPIVRTVNRMLAVWRRHQTGNVLQYITMQTRFSWRSISGYIWGCYWSHEEADGEKPQVSCPGCISNIKYVVVINIIVNQRDAHRK